MQTHISRILIVVDDLGMVPPLGLTDYRCTNTSDTRPGKGRCRCGDGDAGRGSHGCGEGAEGCAHHFYLSFDVVLIVCVCVGCVVDTNDAISIKPRFSDE